MLSLSSALGRLRLYFEPILKYTGAKTDAIESYVRETDQVRRQAAAEYRTSVAAVKKCFNSVMFGRSIAKWKRTEKIQSAAKSEATEQFEAEMKKARVLIAEKEIRRCKTREGKSDKTLMAEAVTREEERIMLKIQQNVEMSCSSRSQRCRIVR